MWENFLPIVHHLGIAHGGKKLMVEVRFNQESAKIGQSTARAAFQEGENGVPEHNIHLIAPGCAQTPEHGNEVGSQQVFLQFGMGRQDVESDRVFSVGGINQNHIANAILWNDAQYLVHQITMWIEDGNTVALFDVLANEIEKQGGFTGAGCPGNCP